MDKRTKIVATVGPACESEEKIESLIKAGANVFRFNLKHNTLEWHRNVIKRIRDCGQKCQQRVGIIADIQGPELRIDTKEGKEVEVKENEIFYLSSEFDDKKTLVISQPEIFKQIEKGKEAYIDNGNLHLDFMSINNGKIGVKADRDYLIMNRKNINIPGVDLELPLFSDKDKEALAKLNTLDIDYLALSFVRTKEDIAELRKIITSMNLNVKIMAKIENGKAIRNLTEIIDESDAVMVARGDLGVEVPIRQLAFWQKLIINMCRQKSKPVIVATQMLLSMVHNAQPTRAEATDVANAVYDASDALMLSEETAMGNYPTRAVEEMTNICKFVEEYGDIPKFIDELNSEAEILTEAAANIVKNSKSFPIKAIVVFTQSGKTARIMSRYRLKLPIIGVTDNQNTLRELSLSYGIIPYYKQFDYHQFDRNNPVFKDIAKISEAKEGDNLIVIHGNNWLSTGSTSDLSLIKL